MRTGGESGKFGNDYEECWTVSNLLHLVDGQAIDLEPEPLRDGIGIEFIKTRADGTREFHSAKVQTTEPYWSIALLTRSKPPGRSILGDLLGKLDTDPKAEAVFVSEVGANPLQLICGDARLAGSAADFLLRMGVNRQADYQDILPLCSNDPQKAFEKLRRLHAISAYQPIVTAAVERDIRRLLYRPDNRVVEPANVRRLLGDLILESLGQKIGRAEIVARLQKEGYEPADWAHNRTIEERVERRNAAYCRGATKFLINNRMIRRKESLDAFQQLQSGAVGFGAFVGVAGLGKSCAIAELIGFLEGGHIPCLALRLDAPIKSLTSAGWGQELDFPMSPVDLLAAMSGGQRSVLILDQLDALSVISGRSTHLWPLVDEVLAEVDRYPNMRVWLGCRGFDLENDANILRLIRQRNVQRVDLQLLAPEEVKLQVRQAGYNPDSLDKAQIEVLRTPMHLNIYIEGTPDPAKPFRTVIDLYDRYWDRKQELMAEQLDWTPKWTAVIDLVCDELTERQALSAPVEILGGELWKDARALASANVLLLDDKVCRFFHEGFFDYAFARRFVFKGRKLASFLVESGEQDLFRRAQVRQVLNYLRSKDSAVYLDELKSLLENQSIRGHILELVYHWLGNLSDPTAEELRLLKVE